MVRSNVYGLSAEKFRQFKQHYESLPDTHPDKIRIQNREVAALQNLSNELKAIGFKPQPGGGLGISLRSPGFGKKK